jgi:hypothetical protein
VRSAQLLLSYDENRLRRYAPFASRL